MAQNISVPDIGDFKEVEVIEVLVKPGDHINKNDPIVTIESDKSSVEIPSTVSGEIKDLKVKVGDKVSEGSILATIENEQAAPVKKEVIKEDQKKEVSSIKKPETNGESNPIKQIKKKMQSLFLKMILILLKPMNGLNLLILSLKMMVHHGLVIY